MHILFCQHIWAELSLLFWTFLSGTFFPGGGGGGARAPSAPPWRTRLECIHITSCSSPEMSGSVFNRGFSEVKEFPTD